MSVVNIPFSSYLELAKPRILTLILITTALGFFLGGNGIVSFPLLAFTILGAGCVCAGASALNHYLERDSDGKMERTKNRPIPAGIIAAHHALAYGIILILVGLCILILWVNLLTAFLSLLTAFLYVLVYTPMKKLSWLNTTIGAIPGAIPPMGGWAAATGQLDLGAWVLFLIMFLWQHPHFYAIAWMCKEDYRLAGFKMLPVIDPQGVRTFRQIQIFSLILIPISLLPFAFGIGGHFYRFAALVLGILFWREGRQLAFSRSSKDAVKLLKTSVLYLPLLFLLIVLDVSF